MSNDIVYQYPLFIERDEIISKYDNIVKNKSKKQQKLLIFCIVSIIFTIIFSSINSTVTTISSIVLFIVMINMKRNSVGVHMLEITADIHKIDLIYHQNSKKTHISLPYKCIKSSLIDEKNYNKVIVYIENCSEIVYETIHKNGETSTCNYSSMIQFDINQFSSEQGFFLYYAPKLFNLNADRMKILNTFGPESVYFNSF